MALASARRLPARTSDASASTGTLPLGADRGIRRGSLALADEAQHAARGLRRGLEERADVDVEAEVGKRGGDHLGAAVVAVLADLGDQDAGPPPMLDGELLHVLAEGRPFLVAGELAAVDARDGADLRPVPAPHLLER